MVVLSIGKLAAGQARYYLDQAEGRVDAVDSVAEGAEEYYLGGTEARGSWVGVGSARLDLIGPVEAESLRAVLAGIDPRDGVALRSARGGVRVAAFDLTFSAPKSVSVLFGVARPTVRDAVRSAHDHAVAEALEYLERSAAFVRRGPAGAEVVPAHGLVAAAFRHRTSRSGDPQLHTHVVAANLGLGADGRWSALDGRRLYAHARTASFIYQAVLRGELTHALGVEWTPVREGIGEVAGVPTTLLRAFSRRRAEIDAALDARGTSGGRAAEAAALATRRPKDRHVSAEDLGDEWRARAAALGLDAPALDALTDRGRSRQLDRREWQYVVDRLVGADVLTLRRSTFSRRDAIRALCERLPPGTPIDARQIEAAADGLLRDTRVVPLLPDRGTEGGASIRRRDGRVVRMLGSELRYSTADQLALEQRLVDRVLAGRGAHAGLVPAPTVTAAVRSRPTLSREQRAVIEALCLDGGRVAVVAGRAGTGKTFALAAARDAWEVSGRPVIGAAIARRAAHELEHGAGIPSTSVSALLARTDAHPLPGRCVLVVDEAGMLPTRQLAALLDRVEDAGGKLVLVGDHRQLPELEAGGAFRGLVRRGLAVELTENRRQVHGWERHALDQLRAGHADEALAAYEAHDRVHIAADDGRARAALVRDWSAAGDLDGAVMIARRRADVGDLNRRARELLHAAGALGPERLDLPGGTVAVGDRVIVKRNDPRRGIHNGDRARIVAIGPERVALEVDCRGRRVTLDADFLLGATTRGEPTLLHGYAVTAHVAQGSTVDRAYVLADEGLSREWAYTAMSRGREHNALYLAARPPAARDEIAPREPTDHRPRERLLTMLTSSEASMLAIDIGTPAEHRRWDEPGPERPDAAILGARRALELSRARRRLDPFDRELER